MSEIEECEFEVYEPVFFESEVIVDTLFLTPDAVGDEYEDVILDTEVPS